MSNDTPELDQYQKDKDEFSDAVDDVLGADESKTDEEIIAEMDKKQAANPDVGGEPKKDPDVPVVKDPPAADDSETDDLTGQEGVPVTKEIDDPPGTIEPGERTVEVVEAELAKERQKTSSWNGRITAANKKVEKLEADILELEAVGNIAKADKNKASTDPDNEVLERFRVDFPELSTAFDIMQKRIDGVTQAPAKVVTDPDTPLPPAKSTSADDANTKEAEVKKVKAKHIADIREVHSDLPEMVNTGVLLSWINKQPSYIRPTLETIYKSGKSEDVITMVTNFKESTGWKSQLKPADDKGTAAQSKLNSMREVTSESTTPNGKVVDKQDYDQGAKDAGL
jgi:hypothetical protein